MGEIIRLQVMGTRV